MSKWLKRLTEHWNDKKLADKCGLNVQEICNHEIKYKFKQESAKYTCMKCGELVA